MVETLTNCPLCCQSDFSIFLKGEDYFLSKEPFVIQECTSCRFRFTNPRPTESSMGKYYKSDDYISHDTNKGGLIPALYSLARFVTLRSKYRIVRKLSQGKTILDIGCGTGEFLEFCQKKGMICQGIEPTKKAREFAKMSYSIHVDEDFLEKTEQPGYYDCITLWHVLEHIHRLDETMVKIRKELKREGLLILALPNCNSFDAKKYAKYWAAYDLPRHIFHFTKETIELLAKKHEMTCTKIIPQKLDAFYISLLSEKYRSGSQKWIPTLFSGLMSNLKAGKPDFGHSSQIYLLKSKIS